MRGPPKDYKERGALEKAELIIFPTRTRNKRSYRFTNTLPLPRRSVATTTAPPRSPKPDTHSQLHTNSKSHTPDTSSKPATARVSRTSINRAAAPGRKVSSSSLPPFCSPFSKLRNGEQPLHRKCRDPASCRSTILTTFTTPTELLYRQPKYSRTGAIDPISTNIIDWRTKKGASQSWRDTIPGHFFGPHRALTLASNHRTSPSPVFGLPRRVR